MLFLASDLANIVTGAVYPIEGARTAHWTQGRPKLEWAGYKTSP